MFTRPHLFLAAAVACAPAALAQDWTNSGGNAANDGSSPTFGPLAADLAWTAGPSSIIGWEPIVAGGRVFSVRQSGFPPAGEPGGSPIVAQDLATGQTLWTVDLPFATGDWTTWIGGASNGALYVSRAGNGATVSAPLVALDQATGAVLWTSADEIRASGYDGMVFASDGDPVVAWNTTVRRIEADTGATRWSVPRTCSVTGACGGAILNGEFGEFLYLVDAVPGGHAVKKYRVATGALQDTGPTMPGFTLQNTPLVVPGSGIAVARTQNNPATDFLYVFDDGPAGGLVESWNTAIDWTTTSEFCVGADGSLYALADGYRLTRFDRGTGAVLAQSAPLPTGGYATRMASDLDGRVYLLTGSNPGSLLYCFEPDLTLRWSTPAPSVNVGGPALAAADEFESAFLVVARKDALVAYRTPSPFTDEGFTFPQSSGQAPTLAMFSALTPGGLIRAEFDDVLPFTPAYLVWGPGTAFLPLGPLTVVPVPNTLLFVGQAGLDGHLELSGTWPASAAASQPIAFQAFVVDLALPGLLAASNGVSGVGRP